MTAIPSCPICTSRSRFWESVKGFKIYKCLFCGHGFFYPGVKTRTELLGHYNEDYSQTYKPERLSKDFRLRQKQYELDTAMIRGHNSKSKISVLDFGCSTGQFLNSMPAAWKKYGYEVNRSELDYVTKHYSHITMFSEIIELKKQKYDLITLRGVIEHLFDFQELFSVLNSSLKKGGKIYICATPDFSSPAAVVYRSKWNQIAPPLHYHQFTAASIAILFAMHNFGLKLLSHPYAETPYADFANDSAGFIRNVKRLGHGRKPDRTAHAFPGTMMSLIFEKLTQ